MKSVEETNVVQSHLFCNKISGADVNVILSGKILVSSDVSPPLRITLPRLHTAIAEIVKTTTWVTMDNTRFSLNHDKYFIHICSTSMNQENISSRFQNIGIFFSR